MPLGWADRSRERLESGRASFEVGGRGLRRPKRAQKSDDLRTFFVAQRGEGIADGLRLAAMEQDGIGQGQRSAIVEIGRGVGNAPEPRGREEAIQVASEGLGERLAHVVTLQIGEERDASTATDRRLEARRFGQQVDDEMWLGRFVVFAGQGER